MGGAESEEWELKQEQIEKKKNEKNDTDKRKEYYPDYAINITLAWIEAGMSLKKRPAEGVRTKHVQPSETWHVVYGKYSEKLRLCFLPTDDSGHGHWFGYDSTSQCPTPIFRAVAMIS